MNIFKKLWVYDLETYPNIFTFCTVYGNGKGIRVFEISDRKNDAEELLDFLRKVKIHDHYLAGFNNINFDYPIVHYIISKAKKCKRRRLSFKLTPEELYKVANELINNDDKFGNAIKPSEVIIPQLDAYKIMHFDNKAKATSLKTLEFNMRSENIEDLPFEPGRKLTDEEKDILIEYNKHDVKETLKFFKYIKGEINLRLDLSKKLGFDVTNHNDPKIGSDLFINRLERERPGICYERNGYKRKIKQTVRDKINLGEVILPYIEFERPEFNAVKNWFENQTITETKGVFTDILESDLGEVAKYANLRTKKQKLRSKPSKELVEKLKKRNPFYGLKKRN